MEEKKAGLIGEAEEKEVPAYKAQKEDGPGGSGGLGGQGGPPKTNLKKSLLIFGCIVLAVVLLGVGWNRLFGDGESDYSKIREEHISVLSIEGTIGEDLGDGYNHQWVLDRIDDAMNNSSNRGLIVFLNTPGGAVYETDEVYLKLREYQRTGRPLYAAMGSMAASGGYYIAAPADKIIANRNCWTGSIGVTAGTVFDISGFLEKYGIKTVTITSGKNKAMGSMTEPLTKEQREIYQSLTDEAYDQFTEIVAEGRSMSIKKVRKLADGRIYTAKQALKNGLIDEIGTLDDAISDMRITYGLEDCQVYKMKYEDDSLFASLFNLAAERQRGGSGNAAALLEYMNEQGQVPISYLSEMRK